MNFLDVWSAIKTQQFLIFLQKLGSGDQILVFYACRSVYKITPSTIKSSVSYKGVYSVASSFILFPDWIIQHAIFQFQALFSPTTRYILLPGALFILRVSICFPWAVLFFLGIFCTLPHPELFLPSCEKVIVLKVSHALTDTFIFSHIGSSLYTGPRCRFIWYLIRSRYSMEQWLVKRTTKLHPGYH